MKRIFSILILFSISIFSNNNLAISDYNLAFKPLNTWHKKDNNFYYGIDGSSINIQSEESLIDLDTYTSIIIKKLKKGYLNYNITEKKYEIIANYSCIYLSGKFDFKSQKNNINMEFYSIIFDIYGEKIIVTIAYPTTISNDIKQKLLNIKDTLIFIGNKTQKKKKKIKLKWHINKNNNYKLLIPNNYKKKKENLFINKRGDFIAIALESSVLELKEYFKQYIIKLKKKYKHLSILEENFKREHGFEILNVNISTNKMKIKNIFYKKANNIYILITNKNNKYIKKIENSFRNLK